MRRYNAQKSVGFVQKHGTKIVQLIYALMFLFLIKDLSGTLPIEYGGSSTFTIFTEEERLATFTIFALMFSAVAIIFLSINLYHKSDESNKSDVPFWCASLLAIVLINVSGWVAKHYVPQQELLGKNQDLGLIFFAIYLIFVGLKIALQIYLRKRGYSK